MPDWNAFAEFMESLHLARASLNLRSHQECFFRGHSNSAWKLVPSLFRRYDRTAEEYWKLERRMFFEFRTRARELYTVATADWDVLFHMQHHGVSTRLLDWSSIFGVALYFALRDFNEHEGTPPCIWLLNPYALNDATWGVYRLFNPRYLAREEWKDRSYDFGELLLETHPEQWQKDRLWHTPLAIYANQRSERMFAQSGWFTIHGTDIRPLEDIFGDRPGILRKIEIPLSAITASKEFLTLAGIGHRQLFPDLDGLAHSINEKFGISR